MEDEERQAVAASLPAVPDAAVPDVDEAFLEHGGSLTAWSTAEPGPTGPGSWSQVVAGLATAQLVS